MPGVGVPAAAVFLAETAGKTFPSGAHLASHIRSDPRHPTVRVLHTRRTRLPRRQQAPKRAMFLSAFSSLRSDPASRAYYQRKRDQNKKHNQAILALAHRRILTLYAMIRDGALYDPQPTRNLPAAA